MIWTDQYENICIAWHTSLFAKEWEPCRAVREPKFLLAYIEAVKQEHYFLNDFASKATNFLPKPKDFLLVL